MLFESVPGTAEKMGVAPDALAEVTAFSPLGEVEFRERGESGTESALSGPSPREAVCSKLLDRPCPVDGGDT